MTIDPYILVCAVNAGTDYFPQATMDFLAIIGPETMVVRDWVLEEQAAKRLQTEVIKFDAEQTSDWVYTSALSLVPRRYREAIQYLLDNRLRSDTTIYSDLDPLKNGIKDYLNYYADLRNHIEQRSPSESLPLTPPSLRESLERAPAIALGRSWLDAWERRVK